MNINLEIKRLINYGINKRFIYKEDEVYVRNRILEILELNEYKEVKGPKEILENPQSILDNILDYCYEKGILENNSVTYRDLLDTKIMDCLIPRPSVVIKRFKEDYKESPELATRNYYKMSKESNYIRTERTNKNICWKTETEFGELDITINLSKPEKDPKAIAESKNIKSSGYPMCLLCKENEGYAGRINHPARQNHRIIPININDEKWFLQYSPYVYYNEHSIILKSSHDPMRINKTTFNRLLEFVGKLPHYFIGSNADLPIVGGSILSHDHYQGGNYTFAMERAPIIETVHMEDFNDVEIGIVKWPLSVIRLRGANRKRLSQLGEIILNNWRDHSDEEVDILAYSKGEPHNTVTPIARFRDNKFELDLVLRNNRTSDAHPLGIFHPHADVHNIKKENIGLIEVMGLAVLPARLKDELQLIKECLMKGKDIDKYEELEKHRDWFGYLKGKYENNKIDYDEVLRYEVGKTFERILIDAGVFKQDEEGLSAFKKFVSSLE